MAGKRRFSAPRTGQLRVAAALCALSCAATGIAQQTPAGAQGPLGVDVSSWQGANINWNQVASAGVQFAYLRAAEGTSFVDGTFRTNWYRATGANILPGAYIFFHPGQDPVAQANLLLAELHSVGFTPGDLLPALDVETTDNLSPLAVVNSLEAAVNTMAAATGAYPVIYTSPAWWDAHVASTAFAADPLWVAHWGVSSPTLPAHGWGGRGWQVWQYSDAGSIAGIPGSVDVDRAQASLPPRFGSAGLMPMQARVPAGVANLSGAPHAVSDREGDVDVVWRASDDRLWVQSLRSAHWLTPQPISASGVQGDPSVVSSRPGRVDVFWLGADGDYWRTEETLGSFGSSQWSAPQSLGLSGQQSPPHAASVAGELALVWRNSSGAVFIGQLVGAGLSVRQVSGAVAASEPSAAGASDGTLVTVWRDSAGSLWVARQQAWGSSSAPARLAPYLNGDPVVVAGGYNEIHIVWSAGTLWDVDLSGSQESAPLSLTPGAVLGQPSLTEPAPATVGASVQRGDGRLMTLIDLPGIGWIGPELLGDGPVASPPALVAESPSHFLVFWRGPDAGLWWSAACVGCDPGAPGLVTPLH